MDTYNYMSIYTRDTLTLIQVVILFILEVYIQ